MFTDVASLGAVLLVLLEFSVQKTLPRSEGFYYVDSCKKIQIYDVFALLLSREKYSEKQFYK